MLFIPHSPKQLISTLAIAGVLGIGILAYFTWFTVGVGDVPSNGNAAITNQPAVNVALSAQEECARRGPSFTWCEQKQKCIDPSRQNCKDVSLDSYLTNSSTLTVLSGSMLYIQDGDVWKSDINGRTPVKLVDRDAVTKAIPSPDGSMIAYAIVYPSTETVKNADGTEESVELSGSWGAKQTLYVANGVGADSRQVQKQVGRWGWIPNTKLLWYETSSLQQYFSWGYIGDNNMWVYDPAARTSKEIRKAGDVAWSDPLLGPRWSPDGKNVLLVTYEKIDDTNGSLALHVVNRSTAKERNLLYIPWVGGDRGGPPPIPSFFWSGDSSTIYTGFTPVIEASNNTANKIHYLDILRSNYISVLAIPVNGGQVKEVFPSEPSIVFADESPIHVNFSEDRSKVLYFAVKSDKVTPDSPSDWVKYGDADAQMVVRDIHKGTSYTISDTFNGNHTLFHVSDDSLSTHITDDGVYWFDTETRDSIHWLNVYYYDFTTSQKTTVATMPAPIDDDRGLLLSDISYLPSAHAVLFRAGSTLYKVQNDKIAAIVEKVDEVAYYE